MWRYRYTDELYHKNGYKYIDKIRTSKGWRYIYDKVLGGDRKKAMQKAANNLAIADIGNGIAKQKAKTSNKWNKRYHKYNPDQLYAWTKYAGAKSKYDKSLIGMAENTGKAASKAYKKAKEIYKKGKKAVINFLKGPSKEEVDRANRHYETAKKREEDASKKYDDVIKEMFDSWTRETDAKYDKTSTITKKSANIAKAAVGKEATFKKYLSARSEYDKAQDKLDNAERQVRNVDKKRDRSIPGLVDNGKREARWLWEDVKDTGEKVADGVENLIFDYIEYPIWRAKRKIQQKKKR